MPRMGITNKNGGGFGMSSSSGYGGRLLKTRQLTAYHVGDDGDLEPGLPASYSVLTTGQFSGTTAIDVPHYACNTLTFAAADKSITDAGAGLVTFLSADTIRVRGSALNDGVYTIAAGTGGAAGHFHTNEALVDEAAGAYVTMCKRATPGNACVIDNITGLMWRQTTTSIAGLAEKIGNVDNGLLSFYDAATSYTLHPAAGDLQMLVDRIKIVGGAAELPRYFAGAVLVFSGFANAVNNLPGYRVTSVAVNGADLDIFLWDGNNTLIAEAAAGARDIKIVCRSAFGYIACMNTIGFAGFTDWRLPKISELVCLAQYEQPQAIPDAVVFPNWVAVEHMSLTTNPATVANYMYITFSNGTLGSLVKTTQVRFAMVRGG